MNRNQKGFSLTETLIGVALIGGAALAAMKIQQMSTKSNLKNKSDQSIEQTAGLIQKALSERAVCTYNLKNKTIGSEITTLANAVFSPSNYDSIIATGENILELDKLLPGDIAVKRMTILNNSGGDFLAVEFNLDPKKSKNFSGAKEIRKLFPLLLNKTGNTIISCNSETDNLIQTASLETCRALKGVMVNGKCNFIDQYIDSTPKNCGGGASYQMKVVNGKITMTCTPCPTPIRVFSHWDCVNLVSGAKYVNMCYYYTACSDNPSHTYGNIISVVGPGGQENSGRKCRRKRSACPGGN